MRKLRTKEGGFSWIFLKHIVIPQNTAFLTSPTLVTSIHTGNKAFTVKDLRNAFFPIPVIMASQSCFPSPTQTTIHLDSNISGSNESPYLSQILKTDFKDIKFPRDAMLLQYGDDSVPYSPQNTSQEEGSIS